MFNYNLPASELMLPFSILQSGVFSAFPMPRRPFSFGISWSVYTILGHLWNVYETLENNYKGFFWEGYREAVQSGKQERSLGLWRGREGGGGITSWWDFFPVMVWWFWNGWVLDVERSRTGEGRIGEVGCEICFSFNLFFWPLYSRKESSIILTMFKLKISI